MVYDFKEFAILGFMGKWHRGRKSVVSGAKVYSAYNSGRDLIGLVFGGNGKCIVDVSGNLGPSAKRKFNGLRFPMLAI